MDLSPLREFREYRLLFIGQVISRMGRELTIVASSIQIYALTGDTFAVGMLGLAQFPALLIGSFLGGTLADALDRRRILIATQIFMAASTAGLAVNAMSAAPAVWLVFAFTMINAFGSAIDSPARSAAVPRIVSTARLPTAFALQILMYQLAAAVGPALGGVVIAKAALSAAYWIDTGTFGVALVTLIMMRPLLPAGGGTRPGFRSIGEGLRFLRTSQALRGIFVIDLTAMVFGMPRALFPEWGVSLLGGDESTVGLLFAAPAIGALVAGLLSGRVSKVKSSGRATVIAVIGWGISIAAFGVSTTLALAVVALASAGAFDALSAIFRQTILQIATPDRLRGRLSAVQIAVVAGGPRIGDAEAGTVAAAYSPQVAAWSGGLAAAIGALIIAKLLPGFSRWRIPDDIDVDT